MDDLVDLCLGDLGRYPDATYMIGSGALESSLKETNNFKDQFVWLQTQQKLFEICSKLIIVT